MTYALKPGDILLYTPVGIFGKLISIKTWHRISHVEVYDGHQQSVASRDGIGVGRYPIRFSQLGYILRPQVPLNLSAGRAYFASLDGTPYGWAALLDFIDPTDLIKGKGIVCSPFAAGFLRACGWSVFPADPVERVAPFQFLDLVGQSCSIAYNLVDGKNDAK